MWAGGWRRGVILSADSARYPARPTRPRLTLKWRVRKTVVMTRTQVLLPDEIYQRARRQAEAREISLAELTRRGLELILEQYAPAEAVRQQWTLPVVQGMGWGGLDEDQLKAAARPEGLPEAT